MALANQLHQQLALPAGLIKKLGVAVSVLIRLRMAEAHSRPRLTFTVTATSSFLVPPLQGEGSALETACPALAALRLGCFRRAACEMDRCCIN